MSTFYGSIQGQAKTEATRRGSKASGITAHVRGWDQGIKVNGFVNAFGQECFEVYKTGGSHDSTAYELLAYIVNGQLKEVITEIPAQEKVPTAS